MTEEADVQRLPAAVLMRRRVEQLSRYAFQEAGCACKVMGAPLDLLEVVAAVAEHEAEQQQADA